MRQTNYRIYLYCIPITFLAVTCLLNMTVAPIYADGPDNEIVVSDNDIPQFQPSTLHGEPIALEETPPDASLTGEPMQCVVGDPTSCLMEQPTENAKTWESDFFSNQDYLGVIT